MGKKRTNKVKQSEVSTDVKKVKTTDYKSESKPKESEVNTDVKSVEAVTYEPANKPDYISAFKTGIAKAEKSNADKIEIALVMKEFFRQLAEHTDNKLFASLELNNLNITTLKSQNKTKMAIIGIIGSGYPIIVTFEGSKVRKECDDKKSLENALCELLEDVYIAGLIQRVLGVIN